MNIQAGHESTFADYAESLRLLEEAFNKAGTPVSFFACVIPSYNKTIEITRIYRKTAAHKIVSIEGDSPAQAVKDVAAVVKL